MFKGSRLFTVIYVLLLVLSLFEINNSIKDIIFAILFVIFLLFFLRSSRKGKKKDEAFNVRKKIAITIALLMSLFLVVSLIVLGISGLNELFIDNIITIGMIVLAVFLAFLANEQFREKNIVCICLAVLINYGVVVIMFFINSIFGVDPSWSGFFGMSAVQTLEIHELAFIAAVALVYLIATGLYRRYLPVTILMAVVTIVNFKRIVFLAFALILVIKLIHRFIIKDLKKTIRMTRVITYFVVFSYLACMTLFLEQTLGVINDLGINMSWRDYFYRMIYSNRSEMSPLLGSGIRSTDYRMSIDSVWNFVGAIHSDILRLFLENGIVLFSAYMITYISFIPRLLRKVCGYKEQFIYSLLILFTLVCYTTDNLFTYYRFIFVLFSLVFALTNFNKIKGKRNVEKKN